KRTRGQLIAASLEGPQAGKQIPAVHSGDVAWTQRLQRAEVIPIKEMPFETLEPIYAFERAKVALHQIVDRDVAEIICHHGRQHRQPDIGWGRAHENLPGWRFLDIVRRQPGGLWSDKIVEVSPGPSCGSTQKTAIVRG